MCTLSLEIIFTVSFSYHFTVWPHLIHYLSYHLCRMDVMSGRRCQSIGIINGDWIHTAHSIRFDSIFPSSNAALHGTVQRGRAGAEYSRSSVRDSHLHVFKVYIKKIQLVRWRETWFAPNRRIECERHWRNTAKRNKKKKKMNRANANCVFLFSLVDVCSWSVVVLFLFPFLRVKILIWSEQTESYATQSKCDSDSQIHQQWFTCRQRLPPDSDIHTFFLRNVPLLCSTHLVAPGAADVLKEQISVAQCRCQLIFPYRLDGCLGRLRTTRRLHNTTNKLQIMFK